MARACCLRLLAHWMRAAASRTFCTAGSNRPMRMAMMAITTSSSISVKAGRRDRTDIAFSQREKEKDGRFPHGRKTQIGRARKQPTSQDELARCYGPGPGVTWKRASRVGERVEWREKFPATRILIFSSDS